MHVFSIQGTDYKAIEDWPEMPCSMAVELYQVCEDMPSLLKELYDLSAKKDPNQKEVDDLYEKITQEDRIKHFPVFYGQIMRILTTVPGDVMEGILWDRRTTFYKKHCERFIQGILYGDYSGIKNIQSFDWNKKTYPLPTSDYFLGNKEKVIPMANEQTIVFTEVADLEIYSEQLKGGKYEVAANIISIMCRPKGEQYDEKKSLARAKEFMDLPMDIVWEVFFCIQQLLIISSQNTLISQLRSQLKDQRKRLKPQGSSRSHGTAGFWRSQSHKYLHAT